MTREVWSGLAFGCPDAEFTLYDRIQSLCISGDSLWRALNFCGSYSCHRVQYGLLKAFRRASGYQSNCNSRTRLCRSPHGKYLYSCAHFITCCSWLFWYTASTRNHIFYVHEDWFDEAHLIQVAVFRLCLSDTHPSTCSQLSACSQLSWTAFWFGNYSPTACFVTMKTSM